MQIYKGFVFKCCAVVNPYPIYDYINNPKTFINPGPFEAHNIDYRGTMGRIKTKLAKRKTMELISSHGEEFSADFDGNKKQAERFMEFPSKKIRNVIAEYLTRIKRREA